MGPDDRQRQIQRRQRGRPDHRQGCRFRPGRHPRGITAYWHRKTRRSPALGRLLRRRALSEISVVVTALQPTTGNAADLRASFTIKGITAELPLPATIDELGDGSVRVSAKTQVDRAQFGLDWNRFGMIGKTATVSADAVFVRAR